MKKLSPLDPLVRGGAPGGRMQDRRKRDIDDQEMKATVEKAVREAVRERVQEMLGESRER